MDRPVFPLVTTCYLVEHEDGPWDRKTGPECPAAGQGARASRGNLVIKPRWYPRRRGPGNAQMPTIGENGNAK